MTRHADAADLVVLGGGVAGLAASLAFARRGRRVLLLERDRGGAGGDAEAAFAGWQRPGIPHFRQPHNFLGLARQTLAREAPDVLAAVLALGALEHRQYELLPGEPQPGDEEFVSLGARRPVFELALRRAVEAEPSVTVRCGTRVVGLLAGEPRNGGGVRIGGVRTEPGGELKAELVIDALGRTSPVVGWLQALGARPPLERRSGCGLLYYSRHFRFRDGVEMPALPALLRGPRAEIGYLAYSVFVGDNRTFALVVMIPTWDRELRALRHEQAYMSAALAMPPLVPWVHPDRSEPITPVLPMGSLQNLHRSLVVDGEPIATGIQPIGDALCHTNPSFAYGASLSLHHAFTLARLADTGPIANVLAFDAAVGVDTATRYDAVAAEDRDRLRLWQGEPLDVGSPEDSLPLFLRMTVYAQAARDPEIFRAVARRVNLLDPADALAGNHHLLDRARRLAQEAEPSPPSGPPRERLLEQLPLSVPA